MTDAERAERRVVRPEVAVRAATAVDASPEVGIAAFVVDAGVSRVIEVQPATRLRGASVVKPLVAWVAATSAEFAADRGTWRGLARRAVTVSDNDATAELWSGVGGERLLAALSERTGAMWQIEGKGEHPSLRVMVTATELARAYAELASDGTDASVEIRRWMRAVPSEQTFGVRRQASKTLAVEECSVAVKCGWFAGERAHAALLIELPGRVVGAAITTRWTPDEITRNAVSDAVGNDTRLAAAHDALAGETIRAATQRALLAAADL